MGPDGNDNPAHPVILTKGFYLGKYEVTQEQYEMVIGDNPSKFKGAKLPVENLSWDDAVEFCQALNRKERRLGWNFGLPTEAQWEYACRAGTTTAYSWGDIIASTNANYDQNIGRTSNVGDYPENPWGFFDMHGNVREWTMDWNEVYSRNLVIDPIGPNEGSSRISRGGSFNFTRESVRSVSRYRQANRLNYIGFRLCLAPSR